MGSEVEPGLARRMWRLLEPTHALTYFAPESTETLKAVGLKGYWMSYFAARSAPMGAATASTVESTFYNFAPWLVRRAIPDAWSFASPSAVLDARWEGVARALAAHTRALDAAGWRRAIELLSTSQDGLNCDGRTLAAGNASLTLPDDELASIWQLITTLREFRGDGHVAALVAAGLSGLDAHLTLVGAGTITREVLQGARGFTDEEWDRAASSLRTRGLLNDDGELTERGHELRRDVEATTDRVALAPWARIGGDGCDELVALLTPLAASVAASGAIPVLSPIGLPES